MSGLKRSGAIAVIYGMLLLDMAQYLVHISSHINNTTYDTYSSAMHKVMYNRSDCTSAFALGMCRPSS